MMGEMKKMFEEKMQALEIENNILKEKAGKVINEIKLNEKMIEEVIRKMGRIPAGSLEDKAEEAMRGISKSPFAQWIVEEVKPKTFNAPMLDKFQGKTDPISHLL